MEAVIRKLTVPELFAQVHSHKCQGDQECHWCSAPCGRDYIHDELQPMLGVRHKPKARRPNSPYICVGCRLLRRRSITIHFLSGGYKDRQQALLWSCLITLDEYKVIRLPEDVITLGKILLKPPPVFALLLTTGQLKLLPQFGTVNERTETKGGDLLYFDYNNTPHQYTIYELELALKGEPEEGLEPGVRLLASLLRPHFSLTKTEKKTNPQGGRPPAPLTSKQTVEKIITRSGQ